MHDPGAHSTQFDVATAPQHVMLRCPPEGPVTSFPKRAGAVVSSVEQHDIVAAKPLHHPADGASLRRRDQQSMIVHEDVGMQRAPRGH